MATHLPTLSGDAEAASRAGAHTGSEYFDYITSVESDRRARSAFQDLVLRIVSPGAALFDFGAGPGIDAHCFAQRGFTLRAYDIDPKMCEFFAEHCRDFIEEGRITLERGSYREFIAREPQSNVRRADLVISNFAPLNLVADVHELFAKFHALTVADGKVLASVLNPYFVGDMKFLWWWRIAPSVWRNGHFFMPGPQAPHMRRRATEFGALSLPYFKLAGVFHGLPEHREPPRLGRGRGQRDAWFRIARARFMFLLFEKIPPAATSPNQAGTYS